MNIRDFVKGYKRNATDNLKKKYVKDNLNAISYLNFNKKADMATRIISATCYEKDNEGNNTGNIYMNSSARYLLFILSLIDSYTNIDVDFSHIIEEYDALEENNLLGLFIGDDNSIISIDEYNKCQAILNMALDDMVQNNLSTHAFIQNQIERFGTLVGHIISPIIGAVNNMDDSQFEKVIAMLSDKLK